jgi:hypothetical protein
MKTRADAIALLRTTINDLRSTGETMNLICESGAWQDIHGDDGIGLTCYPNLDDPDMYVSADWHDPEVGMTELRDDEVLSLEDCQILRAEARNQAE